MSFFLNRGKNKGKNHQNIHLFFIFIEGHLYLNVLHTLLPYEYLLYVLYFIFYILIFLIYHFIYLVKHL